MRNLFRGCAGVVNPRGDNLVKNFLVVALFTALLCLALNARAEARPFDANGNQIIGGRPSGCPFRFCGCGLAKYLGLNDKRLNLAWNWARLFPRTHAQPGAAAVRHHHVMLLEREVSPGHWQVLDFNGGRHLTWRHVRDVGGYVFVSVGGSSESISLSSQSHHRKLHQGASRGTPANSTRGRRDRFSLAADSGARGFEGEIR